MIQLVKCRRRPWRLCVAPMPGAEAEPDVCDLPLYFPNTSWLAVP